MTPCLHTAYCTAPFSADLHGHGHSVRAPRRRPGSASAPFVSSSSLGIHRDANASFLPRTVLLHTILASRAPRPAETAGRSQLPPGQLASQCSKEFHGEVFTGSERCVDLSCVYSRHDSVVYVGLRGFYVFHVRVKTRGLIFIASRLGRYVVCGCSVSM